MRGIDAHHERLFALLGQMDTSGGGHAGLADAAFAAVKKNSHTYRMRRVALRPRLFGLARLHDFGELESSPRAVANVQNINLSLFFQNAIYRSIDVRFVAIKQMPKFAILRGRRATVGKLFQAENRLS
jgi:hypothetical protein